MGGNGYFVLSRIIQQHTVKSGFVLYAVANDAEQETVPKSFEPFAMSRQLIACPDQQFQG